MTHLATSARGKRVLHGAMFTALFASGLACAHKPDSSWTREAFRKELNEYVGKPVTTVIDVYGYPQRELKAPDGSAVYEYNFYNTVREPLYAYPRFPDWGSSSPVAIRGGEASVYGCTIWFELSDQSIKGVRFRGNACQAPDQKSSAETN